VASTKDDDARPPAGLHKCAECGSRFSGHQRYCLSCGARRGPLPVAIEARISNLQRRRLRLAEVEPAATSVSAGSAAAEAAAQPQSDVARWPAGWTMPSPRAAAIAVLGMLALGIMLGSATSQLAQSAGIGAILFESPAAAPPPEEAPEEVAAAPAEEPLPEAEATFSQAPFVEVPEIPEETPEEDVEVPKPPPEAEFEEETLPPVKHVFLIVLGENGFEETFGATSPAPYLAKTLPERGELLPNYYGVTGGVLANEIALLSGQGPTAETTLNCPNYGDLAPGTEAAEGEVEGNGCIYPATTETLAQQLVTKQLKWKAYVEDMEKGPLSGQPASCRHPVPGTPDLNQAPIAGDGYLTWRNPFVYFHSVIDGAECASADLGLEALTADLASEKRTPALSYIVPNACHSGGAVPCEPGRATGALGAEEFLAKTIPAITASAAYKEGGLIAITSAEAPQTGEHADSSACCAYPEYKNLSPAEIVEGTVPGTRAKGGGGRVGMLLLSPFVKPGTVDETTYNHFTLLLTIEELFELEKLGYANEAALLPFDSTVFNYASEEESTLADPPRRSPECPSARAGAAAAPAPTSSTCRAAPSARGRAGRG
jgi:phosphatidylinositol-3-phosphatase